MPTRVKRVKLKDGRCGFLERTTSDGYCLVLFRDGRGWCKKNEIIGYKR